MAEELALPLSSRGASTHIGQASLSSSVVYRDTFRNSRIYEGIDRQKQRSDSWLHDVLRRSRRGYRSGADGNVGWDAVHRAARRDLYSSDRRRVECALRDASELETEARPRA